MGASIPALIYAGTRSWGSSDDRKSEGRAVTMFTIEALNPLGARLFDHADSITNVAADEMEIDIRLAPRVCSNLATLRFRIMAIAEAALR